MPITNVTFHESQRSVPDPGALVIKGQTESGHLYRWKAGDTLSMIAVKYLRPSSDWKILYMMNSRLYSLRHNRIQEGDLIQIPEDWLPLQSTLSFDRTKIEERNQDLQRESYLLKFYGKLAKHSGDSDD